MLTGLSHLHQSLAYLVFLGVLGTTALAFAGAGKKAALAKMMGYVHRFCLLMAGRLVVVVGIGMVVASSTPVFQGWLLSGLVGWAVIEVVAKRMVKPEIEAAQAGDMATGQLIGGAVIELLVVAVMFGLMTARPF